MAAARASNNDLRPDESQVCQAARIDGEGRSVVLMRFADVCRVAHVELAVNRDDGFAVAPNFDAQQFRSPRLATVRQVTLRHASPLAVAPPEQTANSTSRFVVTRRGAAPRCQ